MNIQNKLSAILPLAGMFLATAFAASTLAQAKDLHIQGSFEAKEDHTPLVAPIPPNPPALILVQLEGTGYATHLGQYLLTVVERLTMPAKTGQGTFEIDAGCGNTLSGTVVGQGTQIDPTHVSIIETDLITGGTGRFKGATGTLTVHRVVDQSQLFTSSGVVEGTLTLPDRHERGGRR